MDSNHETNVYKNVSHIYATVTTVNVVKNKEHPCRKVIQGPPRKGNTSMLVSILSILLHMRYTLLVCAPTNATTS